mgnify:FL=1
MSLKLIIALGIAALGAGVAIGYYLRVLIALSKKGSFELELKERGIKAEEEAKKIILAAESKASETLQQVREEIKEKEDKLKKTEDRLISKESLLDRRQPDIDKEVEMLKGKVVEIKDIKDRAEKLLTERQSELERVSRLSAEEAKGELFKLAEKKFEEDEK